MYTHTRDEIKEIIKKLQDRLDDEDYAEVNYTRNNYFFVPCLGNPGLIRLAKF